MAAVDTLSPRPLTRVARWAQLASVLTVVAAIALAVCLGAVRWAGRSDGPEDAHKRVHRELGLSVEQTKALEPLEARFRDERTRLEARLAEADRRLAAAIRRDKGDSPEVARAVGEIHEAMGELQIATLRHVFEMKQHLRPEQYERLVERTARGLDQLSDGR